MCRRCSNGFVAGPLCRAVPLLTAWRGVPLWDPAYNAGEGLIDSPGLKTWDFSLFKEFRIKESHRLQFRVVAFNLFNTPQFAGPDATLGDAAFGRITTTTIDNREVQFALKYSF
jgi:hypothetical protein